MRPQWPQIDLAKIANTIESVRSGFVNPAARSLNDMRKAMQNGLLLGENVNGAWIEFEAKHGVEARVPNPLKGVPRAFWPESAFTLSNFTALGGRLTGTEQTIAAHPRLNTTRTDGFLGLTVQYAPSSGDISLSNFSTASAQTTTVDRSVATLTLNPGSWVLSATAGLAGVPTGFTLGLMSIFTAISNGGSDANGARVWSSVAPNGNSDTSLCIAALPVSLTVATTYYAVLRANFTGGSVSGYGRLSALRVAPDPTTIASVRGYLVGG